MEFAGPPPPSSCMFNTPALNPVIWFLALVIIVIVSNCYCLKLCAYLIIQIKLAFLNPPPSPIYPLFNAMVDLLSSMLEEL